MGVCLNHGFFGKKQQQTRSRSSIQTAGEDPGRNDVKLRMISQGLP